MGKAILTVEDSKTAQAAIRYALERVGYTLYEARNAEDALTLIDEIYREGKKLSMLVLDLNMPGMNGIELLTTLKKDPRFKALPAIFLSTEHRKDLVNEAKHVGSVGWLVKPFQPIQLISVIERHIKENEASAE